jgi:hypothetical protein
MQDVVGEPDRLIAVDGDESVDVARPVEDTVPRRRRRLLRHHGIVEVAIACPQAPPGALVAGLGRLITSPAGGAVRRP